VSVPPLSRETVLDVPLGFAGSVTGGGVTGGWVFLAALLGREGPTLRFTPFDDPLAGG
jgi:hypothetical protein